LAEVALSFNVSRRYFFYGSLLAGAIPTAGFGSSASLKRLGYKSPNEKLNIAGIGVGGKGRSDLAGCHTENIVALCDVDDERAAPTYQRYPKAARYKDFRQMLDKEGNNIDAVTISSPDHMHAIQANWAMERGKHVYVQKPLTRTVWESRLLRETANRNKVATQMGNQGYSNEGTRQLAEIIWSGEIGNVTEVHAWTNRPVWPQGVTKIPAPEPVRESIAWDLWLGIAEDRPYTSGGPDYSRNGGFYAPFNWRGFYDFGCGALGDMACHILGAPNLALRLGTPTSVECVMQEGTSDFMFPHRSIIRFDFPARGSMPALKLFWYDGLKENPKIDGVPSGEWLGDLPTVPSPQTADSRERSPFVGPVFDYAKFQEVQNNPNKRIPTPNGSVFIGDKGIATTGTYGENTRLLPVDRMRDYKWPEQFLTRSPGHYADWIRACKGGEQACSNFNVAAPFVEWMLLGVIALRVKGKLEYDPVKMRFTNNNAANAYLKPTIRKGWTWS
jgi:hypothetical protein